MQGVPKVGSDSNICFALLPIDLLAQLYAVNRHFFNKVSTAEMRRQVPDRILCSSKSWVG